MAAFNDGKKVIAEADSTQDTYLSLASPTSENIRKINLYTPSIVVKKENIMEKLSASLPDLVLVAWFKDQRRNGIFVDAQDLKNKAVYLYKFLKVSSDFIANEKWFIDWQRRHYIRSVQPKNHHGSVRINHHPAVPFRDNIQNLIIEENFALDQIFSCDETGFNCRLASDDDAGGLFDSQLTIMACSNLSGTCKLPLVVISPHPNPPELKDTAAVSYKCQQCSWMTGPLLEEWFYTEFVPGVEYFLHLRGLPPRAVLFINNCGASPRILCNTQGIRAVFLPSNVLSASACLQALKMACRRRLEEFSLDQGTISNRELGSYAITFHKVIAWLADLWHSLPQSIIMNSWKPLWPDIEDVITAYKQGESFIELADCSYTDVLTDIQLLEIVFYTNANFCTGTGKINS